MSVPAETQPIETLADLLDRLGSIPLRRIRFHPFPGTATEADVLVERERAQRLCELVDGVLVEKAMEFYEARLASCILRLLDEYADRYDLGLAVGADGAVCLVSGLVRVPDVSFFSWRHFPGRKLPSAPIPHLTPDLAVEVLCESNTTREMERKRREYFEAGVRRVWEVDPTSRSARLFTSPVDFQMVEEAADLVGDDVLPGFRVRLGAIFERAGERANPGEE